jgi:sec-independent protein translocase protein TatC
VADIEAIPDGGATARNASGAANPAPAEPAPAEPARAPGEMSLVDHLVELRNRLIKVVIAIALFSVVGFVLGDQIVAVLKAPLPGGKPLFFTGIGDAFTIKLKIAVVVGIILAMPVILWQVWRFIAPGLTPDERRVVRPWLPLAFVFFALGTAIAYIVLPFAAGFLIGFETPDLQALITAGEYFNFVTTMFLAFGLIMEFPILLFGLSRVGIVTSKRLATARRPAILGIAIFAAGITPGTDLVSPTVLGLTMYLLFEGTIFFIRRSGR